MMARIGVQVIESIDAAGAPRSMLEMGEVQATARTLGLEVATCDCR
jgi:hypothetical protein